MIPRVPALAGIAAGSVKIRAVVPVLLLLLLETSIGKPAISAEVQHPTGDRRRVEILYSENDALCRPLAGVYNKLSHEHPRVFDWEDRYVRQFNAIGLRQPRPLNDRLHRFQKEPLEAYYRLRFPGEQHTRLVFLQDTWFNNSGAFLSDVWIFKPLTDVPDKQFFNIAVAGPGASFDPKAIHLAVLFYQVLTPPEGYKLYTLPYYFWKIANRKQIAKIKENEERHTEAMVPRLASSPYTVQRLFRFGRNILMLAENEEEFLVYQLVNGRIDDVCYFETAGDLSNLREFGWSPEGETR